MSSNRENKQNNVKIEQAWQRFREQEQLTDHQVQLFSRYMQELVSFNEQTNITTIASEHNIMSYHFQDSLALGHYIDLASVTAVCDVGSGGGFPGIPLKIKYPHLSVVLLEVNTKKIEFLKLVIAALKLEGIEVCSYDWRTLLRKAPYPSIDYFLARASLKPEELVRLFQPGYRYNGAHLVYWASREWQAGLVEKPYIYREESYKTGLKQRRLIFMRKDV
jgi:16S rRNA (guanine527-N7)-methyltransferase